MRILVIRGKNLASLADDFEVLLEEGVLQNVGLFAITGPTGAGKSTILDALCLALYDQIPRLPEGHGVAIGHKEEDEAIRVKSHDVSSILRRGTASAYAEVDFIGQDKHTYRARWEISRARGKVNGRLQAQKISLQDLHSAEKIGQGKKDTQQEIIQRLGLNFDQFRRSALLAQGDFAAFLKAKKDERSSLLEKITGTDIYSELSIAAFERAKQEKSHLDHLLEKLADKTPLTADTRAELEQEKQLLAKQLTALLQNLKDKQKIIVWYNAQVLLKKEQQAMQEKAQLAQQQWDADVANRTLLQQVEQAQPLRLLLQIEKNLQQEWQESSEQLSENQSVLAQYQHSLSIITKRVTGLHQAFIDLKQSHSDAQPLLIAARKLDTQIDASQSSLSLLGTTTAAQQEKWQSAYRAQAVFIQQKIQQENDLQHIRIWQEQHGNIQQLANEWGRWEAQIKAYITLDQECQQEQKIHAKVQADISCLQSQLKKLRSNISKTLIEKNRLIESLELLEKKVLALPLMQLHQQKSQLDGELETINSTLLLAEKSLTEQTLLQQHQTELITAESLIKTAYEKIKHLDRQQVICHIQCQEAQQALSLMTAASAKTAVDLRALLKEQQPCPVCGSQQHPWEAMLQPVQQPVFEQQSRVAALQAEKEQLIKDLTDLHSLIKQTEKSLAESVTCIAESKSLQTHLLQQWSQIVVANKPVWTDIRAATVIDLTAQSQALKVEYTKVKQQESQALKQQEKLNELRIQTEKLQQLYATQTAEIAELDKNVAAQTSGFRAKNESLQRLEIERNNILLMLNTPLQKIENWCDQLTQATNSFLQKMTTAVNLWHTKSTQLADIQQQLQQIEKQLLAAETEKNHQHQLYTQYQQNLEQQTQQYQDLKAQRKQYFKGISANDYAASIDSQLQQAEACAQQAESERIMLNTDIKSCASTIEHWQKEQQRRVDKKIIAEQALLTELQKQRLSKQALLQLLTKDLAWIEAQKVTNQTLSKALQEYQVALSVKTESLQSHEINSPQESEENALGQLKSLIELQEKLTLEMDNNSFILRSDDEKIRAGALLQQQLQVQQQCWEQWESLNELIGSSNGHKFRIFAQGLTLETLLTYTNRHLQEFARRYYLQRVPGSDLELQVIDRDMADEVRSVHSLSGGESFLVSLALALGLASLSSNKTQVESLFIDEGFGSLDQETLDVAIASLDTLQALGRKVGVISHVAVLVERIGVQVVVEKLGGGQSKVTTKAM